MIAISLGSGHEPIHTLVKASAPNSGASAVTRGASAAQWAYSDRVPPRSSLSRSRAATLPHILGWLVFFAEYPMSRAIS